MDQARSSAAGRAIRRYAASAALLVAAGSLVALPYAWWRYGFSIVAVVAALGTVGLGASKLGRLSHFPARMAVMVGAGIAARVGMLFIGWSSEPANDPLSYRTLAQALVDGRGMVAWGMRAHYPPLYPLLLAGAQWLTGSPRIAPALLNLAADAGSALLLHRLARRYLPRRSAQSAAAALFLWPTFVAASAVAQKESLTLLLALGVMATTLRLVEQRDPQRPAALLGLLAGLLALTQPALASFPAILLMIAWRAKGLGWRPLGPIVAMAAAVALLTMLPWWTRNWLLFGTFVPLTSVGGAAMIGHVDPAVLDVAGSAAEVEWGRQAMARALGWIVAHPVGYLRWGAMQIGRALGLDIAGVQQYFWFKPPLPRGFAIAAMTLCQLCWIGLWLRVGSRLRSTIDRRWTRDPHLLLTAAVLTQLLAVNVWLQFHERHRYLLTPLLILIALRDRGDRPAAVGSGPSPSPQ